MSTEKIGGGRPAVKGAEQDDDQDRVVVHRFATRPGRTTEIALHSYQAHRYFEIATFRLEPVSGQALLSRRISLSVRCFAEFRRGAELLALQLAREGLL
jgi:hypothetical protein